MFRRFGFEDPERMVHDYPDQLSRAMCQLAMIAISLIRNPAPLIGDDTA